MARKKKSALDPTGFELSTQEDLRPCGGDSKSEHIEGVSPKKGGGRLYGRYLNTSQMQKRVLHTHLQGGKCHDLKKGKRL